MTDRAVARRTFLAGSTWENWQAEPLAGDASARRYDRLTPPAAAGCDSDPVILMDADPATGERTAPFAAIAGWLRAQGFAAPVIHLSDSAAGFLLLEDLGPITVADAADRVAEQTLYDAAVDVLIALDQSAQTPGYLPQMTPEVGAEMVAITAQTYHRCDPTPLVSAMRDALTAHAPLANRLALRDYHAENLIWRPDRHGTDRIGLLDFQDAFVAPRGYDLASLLRDVRRVVSPAQVARQTERFATATGVAPDTFGASLATLGAQRNLRILGIFARLIAAGKPRYAALLPCVWDQLLLDLAHPALHDLRETVLRALPPPQDRP